MQINAAMKMGSRIPFIKGPELGLSDEKLISQILRRIIGSNFMTTLIGYYAVFSQI